MIAFEWGEDKAKENIRKHRVSFDEAKTVFSDENAVELYDEDNQDVEDRYILIGKSLFLRILIVCNCLRSEGDVIRIFSARKATRSEKAQYQKERRKI